MADMQTPSSGTPSSGENLPYYCYPCQRGVQPITEEMICPHCRDGFVVSNDERDVLVAGENSGQPQQPRLPAGMYGNVQGSMNYNMVETSLRNAMNMGIMQPGMISFSINGQPPTQMTIPGPTAPPASTTATSTSGSTRATSSANAASSRIFSTLVRGNQPTTTSATAETEAGGLPEIEMIQDIISRVFGNGAEALIGPHAAHNASGTTGREVASSASGATGASGGVHARIVDHVAPPLWRMGELHGNPQDYAWGQNGFDNIISQLLGQLDNVGPPPATDDTINNLPKMKITSKNIEDLAECSVCMDFFKLDEIVKKMPCNHLFHQDCIDPWLNLHNTCPICRKQVGHPVPQQQRRGLEATATDNLAAPSSNFPQPHPTPSFRWNSRPITGTLGGNPHIHHPFPTASAASGSAVASGRLPSMRAGASSFWLPPASGGAPQQLAETLFFPFFSGSIPTQPPRPQPSTTAPSSGGGTRDPTTGEDQPPQQQGNGGGGTS